MSNYFTVTELASRFDCRPRDISDAFYQRRLDVARCLVVGGRRLIPADYVDEVKEVLQPKSCA